MIPETPWRLDHGGLIDRARSLSFSFDGKSFRGHPGDTLASALLANGVALVGRSFKYHRPRGVLTAGPEEPNALVELRRGGRREPNTRATTVELYDGLEAQSQNRWPSLGFDIMAASQLAAPFFPAGFYYKTFMWPAAFWEKVYEPLIRRAAGLGRAAVEPDPDHYEKGFLHCDLLVIGAGPAGLAAALAAARAGARVILAEQDFELGGRLIAERGLWRDGDGAGWLAATLAELAAASEVRILRRTTVFGAYDHGVYGAVERVNDHVAVPPAHEVRQRSWRITARACVLAAGAIERLIAFPGNDLPGVMLAGAFRTYLNRHAALPGKRVVIFTACDDGWRTVRDALSAGVAVKAIVDVRERVPTEMLVEAAQAGVAVLMRSRIVGTLGGRRLRGVRVETPQGGLRIHCDALAVSAGWNPTVHLTCHLGGKPVWRDDIAAFAPGALPPGLLVAGAAAGGHSLASCLAQGFDAAEKAASALGFRPAPRGEIPAAAEEPVAVSAFWRVAGPGKAFVDLQNDVTADDIRLASQEGFRSVEHMKRYTTQGMATDQGKIGNVTALAILAEARGEAVPAVGATTFRPPYTPVAIGALAGHHRGKEFRPTRLSPAHTWAKEAGAAFMEAGVWLRPAYFPRPGEADWFAACNREVLAVRNAAGLCDVSTLGKIDVQGADAAAFLDRVYTNTMSTLAVGKARYGLMLREDGFVFDDGTAARFAEDHFVVSTTTANAGPVLEHLEFCQQALWPDLDVQLASVSDQWAQFAIAGPKARDILRKLVDSQHDISNEAFPYMAAGPVTVCGVVPGRLFRISFSGELGFELAVPARFGAAFAAAAMAAGADYGLTPYGLEALNVMRIEKGHVTGGELNGQTTVRDLGLGRMVAKGKDCIGKVMAERPALVEPARPILVGVKVVTQGGKLGAGAHFVPVGAEAKVENDQGWVTSACFSPVLAQSIGLGFLARGRERIGERIRAVDPIRDRDVEVEVCEPVFHDPKGERLRV